MMTSEVESSNPANLLFIAEVVKIEERMDIAGREKRDTEEKYSAA